MAFLVQYQFQHCRVDVYSDTYLETVFEDGAVACADFVINDETRQTAYECGYPTDDMGVRRMHFEHELAHTFISEALGRQWSWVLRRVAIQPQWTFSQDRWDEEGIVLGFQKYLNTGEMGDFLPNFLPKNQIFLLALEFTNRFRQDP